MPWGEVNRLQRLDERVGQEFSDERPSIGVRGVGGQHGAVFTYNAQRVPQQKRRYGVGGGSYVSVVEFGPVVRRLAVHTMGASGDPNSPHYFDQAPLYARESSGRRGLRSRRSSRISSGSIGRGVDNSD